MGWAEEGMLYRTLKQRRRPRQSLAAFDTPCISAAQRHQLQIGQL